MGDDTTRPADFKLTEEHRRYLEKFAINVDLAQKLGVHSMLSDDDLIALDAPGFNFRNHPAIVFPWTNEDGEVMWQAKPDNPTKDQKTGRLRKYAFGRGAGSILWAVRPVPTAERILIVEGTKQCLAAASYAPPGIGVYGIAGIRNWQKDKRPIADLYAAENREVVVIPDADAQNNPQVYAACIDLAKALLAEGATKVLFGRLVGGEEKDGLDDVLGGRPEARRASWLARVIETAKPKPADKVPVKQKVPTQGDDRRVTVIVNNDRFEVINDLTAALLKRWNAIELFDHGGVISRRTGGVMTPVDRGTFHDIIQATARTMNENQGAQGTTMTFSWPDSGTMAAVLSRSAEFATLDRMAHAPFARPDGTIVTTPGYDAATRTILMMDPALDGIEVPDSPSPKEISAARELLLTEWLGDFPLDTEGDKANLLALLLTPAIRGMVPRVPLAVIDGLQMGVGKNLLADVLLTVYTGESAKPMNWVSDPEELRKQITSAFRQGSEFFVFDEAHTLEGAPLAQALTAETWQDRILGVSTMANFPNKVTWISLGNNVVVKGDITRRVYRIAIRPTGANPQDRKASSFRHPGQSGLDLPSWTRKHRRELLVAILTLVRAWFASDSPPPSKGVSFGSFETWEKVVGGIIEHAGLTGFLGDIRVWRSESDFDTQYWTSHLAWLREQFGNAGFRTADVKSKALTAGGDFYPAPPRLDDAADKAYGKSLGEAYSRNRGRRYGSLWIEKVASAHGNVGLWQVHDDDLAPPPRTAPAPEPNPSDVDDKAPLIAGGPFDTLPLGGIGHDTEVSTGQVADSDVAATETAGGEEERAPVEVDIDVVAFDLETGDADDLYRGGPGYVRIGATAADDQPVVPYDESVPQQVAADIRRGRTITGHNIMAFDLPALVREDVMKMPEIHELAADGSLFDTLLVARHLDPPMARDHGVDHERRYDLGTLATKFGLGDKLSDVSKALAKKYGGWGEIPIDDSEDGLAFKKYMVQDVELSRSLHARLLEELGGTVPDYLVREHKVAAIAAQISMNGFLVDQPLVAERIAEIGRLKAESMGVLAGRYGVPTANAKGVPFKSPLASAAGKDAITAALLAAGVPEKALWRTEKAGDLQISADAMTHYGSEYHHLPAVREIARHVGRIVSARSVYETARNSMMPDGRCHPGVSMAQATGRWSLTRPGLTVFGKRGGRHKERAIFLPDPGHLLVAFDLSQVDMRAIAGLSQDKAYIAMLMAEDPHAEIARLLFGDPKMREVAKPIGHGWNYGRGVKAISQSNDLDPAVVWKFDQSMRERFPRLLDWQAEVRAIAESGQLLDNGFGRKMRPDPRRAHTQGPALMGQGCARDLMMQGMLRLPAETLPMLRAQVHDEIVLSIPVDQVKQVSEAVVDALSFEWKNVPILADSSRPGTSWAGCYEKG